jgi:hypothetical protein
MPLDDHERAQSLVDRQLVEGLAAEESAWLKGHIASCPECAQHAEETVRMLAAMSSLSFEAAAIHRTRWRRIALIAAALGMLAALPVYRRVRDAEMERRDTLLMESVAAKVSQTVPAALEPLQSPAEGVQ